MSSGMSASLAMHAAQRMEMTLSPQMIQSMELLQMPLMQLEQRIRQEQLENPALETAELEDLEGEGAADSLAGEEEGGGEDEPEAGGDSLQVESDDDEAPGLEHADDVDYDWDEAYDEYSPTRGADSGDDEAFDPVAGLQSRPPSLLEHLLIQLAEASMPDRLRRLAAGMAEKLDANGWLTIPLADAVPESERPVAKKELEAALAELQKLDPEGVGARSLSECLLLQLRDRPEADSLAAAVIRNHLEDLAANRLPTIARRLKCGLEEVKRVTAFIRTLNPRPAADYSEIPTRAVKPEIRVEGDAESGFDVSHVSGDQPRISEFFLALFDNSRRGRILRERLEADPERGPAFLQFREQVKRGKLTRVFREKFNHAQWLTRAVAQLERTILAVAREIIRSQPDYLAGRRDAPSPLFMRDIAEAVGYDISTVSRAVSDKYIDTPLGVKPLKHFFARGGSEAGAGEKDGGKSEARSSASVLLRIRDLIETEDRRRPLRDNEIMERLTAEGVAIKRRSVVNYREKLGFPSHSQRREH